MIDPELERRYADCVELMDAWKSFLDLITRTLKDKDALTPQNEELFLATKARVAMLHDSFTGSLKHDKQIGQNMLDLVNRSISLRFLATSHEAEQKKLEIEWHEVFLLLNETVSSLNEDREVLANRNEFTWRLGKLRNRAVVNVQSFFRSIYFKIGLALVVILFVVFGVPALGIYDYDKLRDERWAQKPLSSVYGFSRNWLGMQAPFMSMEEFRGRVEALNPGSIKREHQDRPKEAIINALKSRVVTGLSRADQDSLGDELTKADGAVEYRFTDFGRNAHVSVFWFRNTADAKLFELNWVRGRSMANNIEVVRKVNVLIFIWTPRPEDSAMAELLTREIFNPIKPTK